MVLTDPSVRRTTYAYDDANQLKSVTYSDGVTPNVTDIVYDANGQRTAMTDGTGTSTWTWDSLHRLTASSNGAGQTVGYGYDLGGRLTSLTYPGSTGTVTRTYDAADRLTAVRDWAGRTTTFGYDADSNLITQTYPNGTQAALTPDGAGQLMSISHAPSATPSAPFASFSYGRNGAGLVTSVNSTGVPTDNHTWGYNQLNQLTNVDSAIYDYDAAENLSRRLDGTTQVYDAAHQLNAAVGDPISLVGTASATGATSTSLTMNLPAGTAANDQVLVAATLPYGKTINTPSGYTLVGTYTSGTSNTSAKVVVFRRTVVAGDTSVAVPFQGKFSKTATLAVYRNVHPTQPIEPPASGFTAGGTSVTAQSVTASLAGERLIMITGASGTTGTWTAPGGMTPRAQQGSGTTDSAMFDQPLAAIGPTDPRTATHGTSTQLVGVLLALKPAGTSYAHDSQGNRTGVTSLSGTTVNHAYDQANRLTGYGVTATYRYNGDGLRTSKTLSGVITEFTWSLAEGLPLLLSEGTTNYIYGPGGLPLERVDSTGAVVYYHYDQLGSTRALSNATGAVVATYTYDAYGNVTASTGSAVNPFRYAGQYTDPESGYQYLRARYYDPTTANFLTRDPREVETGQPYSYANNSPLNFTDPTGEVAWVAAAAIGWAAFEIGSAVMDAVSTAGTLADPCASGMEKLASGGLFIFGMAAPGGFYSTGAKRAGKWLSPQEFADDVIKQTRNRYRGLPTETGQHGAGLRAAARDLREEVRTAGYLPEIQDQLLRKADEWEARARTIDHPGRRR